MVHAGRCGRTGVDRRLLERPRSPAALSFCKESRSGRRSACRPDLQSGMRNIRLAFAAAVVLTVAACKASPSSSGSTRSAGAQPGATSAQSGEATRSAEPKKVFSGSVIETMNSGGDTYLHLKSGSDDVWAAAPEFDAKTGETISVSLDMPMQNFQSR